MSYYGNYWAPYVPVAKRRANAQREMEKLRKNGKNIQPLQIEGRKIAKSFWGESWCTHLENSAIMKIAYPEAAPTLEMALSAI